MNDKLDRIFEYQAGLNNRIGVDTRSMTADERCRWVLNYCRAMSQEVAELTDSVPWKWWARYQTFDQQNAQVEVVDMLHFLVSLAQVLDMSADDLFTAYLQKHEVNVQRQHSGYAIKDEADNRHIGRRKPRAKE